MEKEEAANGYERRKRRKRAQIVTAAVELFRDRGFNRASMNQIAERANVSQVTIYNHFGDKRGLVEEVLRQMTMERIDLYREILTSDAPWPERLRTVMLDKKQLLREYQGEFIETIYREYPDLIRELRDLQDHARTSITCPFLDEGRSRGFVPADISNDAVATYLQVIAKGIDESPALLRRFGEEPTLFDEFYELIVYGMVRGGR